MTAIREAFDLLKEINLVSVVFRILLATIIGALIGMDRGRHGRAAGTRTHILVCLGAAVTTLLGFYTTEHLGYGSDPLRMGAQVVSGIGFLGVGTIMVRNHSHVTGLTTAAGLWTTACIGLSIGAGFYSAAFLAFFAVIFTFTLLSRLERRWRNRSTDTYYIELTDVRQVKAFLDDSCPLICGVEIVRAKSGLPGHVGLEISAETRIPCKEICAKFQQNEHVVIAIPNHF